MGIHRFILKSKTLGEIGLAVSRNIFLDSLEDMCLIIAFKINFSYCSYENSNSWLEVGCEKKQEEKQDLKLPPEI